MSPGRLEPKPKPGDYLRREEPPSPQEYATCRGAKATPAITEAPPGAVISPPAAWSASHPTKVPISSRRRPPNTTMADPDKSLLDRLRALKPSAGASLSGYVRRARYSAFDIIPPACILVLRADWCKAYRVLT